VPINHEELIDMTAMVDIVFFLLIFFLVTSMSAVQSSAMLPRPEAKDGESGGRVALIKDTQPDSTEIIVKISKDDLIEIEGVPYREMEDLRARLNQLRNANGAETSMLILGHGDASHGVAASILDAGYEVGINRLRLSVIDEESD
jgi:biopolymer transport protein ExbD